MSRRRLERSWQKSDFSINSNLFPYKKICCQVDFFVTLEVKVITHMPLICSCLGPSSICSTVFVEMRSVKLNVSLSWLLSEYDPSFVTLSQARVGRGPRTIRSDSHYPDKQTYIIITKTLKHK